MSVSYHLYIDAVEKNKDAVGKDQPIEMEIMDLESLVWKHAKVLLSKEPIEGGKEAAILSMFGSILEEGEWYVKILEELPSPLEGD